MPPQPSFTAFSSKSAQVIEGSPRMVEKTRTIGDGEPSPFWSVSVAALTPKLPTCTLEPAMTNGLAAGDGWPFPSELGQARMLGRDGMTEHSGGDWSPSRQASATASTCARSMTWIEPAL